MAFARSYWIPDLSHRALLSEFMDDITADEKPLFTTLKDFKTINRFVSQTPRVLRETIIADIHRRKASEVTFLDIAAGGCDTGLWFARYCHKHGIACKVYCLDKDPRAIAYAREVCRDEPTLSFIESDVRNIAKLELKVDYAFTNHFFHHLEDHDIPDVFRIIRDCSRFGFVVHDLHRHSIWFLGFTLLGSILWRGGFTFVDGRTSIRRGFKHQELIAYIKLAQVDATISQSGLGHWLVTNIQK